MRAALLLSALSSVALAQDIPDSIAGHVLPSWVAPSLAGAFLLVGLLEISFGYKLFRVTLFFSGFLAAFIAVCLAILEYVTIDAAPWIGLGVGGAAGLLLGGAGALYPRVGVFLITAAAGVCVGLIFNTAFGYRVPINHDVTLGILAGGGGLLFGTLGALFMRVTVIISTSIVGAFLIIYGAGRLIPPPNNLPNLLDLESELVNNAIPPLVYGYLAFWALLSLVGMYTQFRFTGRKPRGRENDKDEWEQVVEDGKFRDSACALQAAAAAAAAAATAPPACSAPAPAAPMPRHIPLPTPPHTSMRSAGARAARQEEQEGAPQRLAQRLAARAARQRAAKGGGAAAAG